MTTPAINPETLANRLLNGGLDLTESEAYALEQAPTEALLAAATRLTDALRRDNPRFDSCSIVNARSGRCSENCSWCAQSAHYATGCTTYDVVSRSDTLEAARHNAHKGIGRLSLVASGRKCSGAALREICSQLTEAASTAGISTCASLGLLGTDELRQLRDAGVRRYHCNLETAPSRFPSLCTTHTMADKLATIAAARALGFEICSGGIIGMGENERQRIELALALREARPVSIPINILCPIPGTPLADRPPLSPEEVLRAVALFRFVHPRVVLRFAGGRAALSKDTQRQALAVGINGSIMGDMLTTVGSQIDEDIRLFTDAGYQF